MNLSSAQDSSGREVESASKTPSPFTTILNIPLTSLPSYLPPSSSLLTPPAVSPGAKFHTDPREHSTNPSADSSKTNLTQTTNLFGHGNDTPSPITLQKNGHAEHTQAQSGYLDYLKNWSIDAVKVKNSLPASSVPSLWSPAGVDLHNDTSMLSHLARAGLPLLPPQRYNPNHLLMASTPRHTPLPPSTTASHVPTAHATNLQLSPSLPVTTTAAGTPKSQPNSQRQDYATPRNHKVSLPGKSSRLTKEDQSTLISSSDTLVSPQKPDLKVLVPEDKFVPPAPPVSEEEGIDVCNFKEPSLLLKKAPQHLHDREKCSLTDDESEQDSDPPLPTFSHLGSECARTVPSLMKFYSRHKRSLSSSLTVSLSVSGQATPPSSPISPGTLPRPALSSRDKTPTPKSEESRSDAVPHMSHESRLHPSTSISTPTLLTIPKVVPTLKTSPLVANHSEDTKPKKVPTTCSSQEQQPLCFASHYDESKNVRSVSQRLLQTLPTEPSKTGDPIVASSPSPAPPSLQVSTSVPSILPPVTSSTGILQGPMALNPFATPWPVPHNPCPPPGIPSAPFWIPQGIDPNIGARIGLEYHLASHPLTGHLFLVPRAHPLSDPSGHGLVWAGFGAPQVVMTPQQLLLGDAHYRHPLHPQHSLLHVPHPQVPSVPSPVKKDDSSPIMKDDPKKTPSTLGAPATTNFQLPPGIPPANLQPHFIYPPTSLPYFFPQSSHPSQYHHLASFNHVSTSLSLSQNLVSSYSTQLTSSTTTLTTTMSMSASAVSTSLSKSPAPTTPTSTLWSGSSNKATSPPSFFSTSHRNLYDNKEPYSEPPIDLTHRAKSPSQLHTTTLPPSTRMQPLSPLSVSTTANLQGFNFSKQTTTTFIIKKEIKQEVLSPNCVVSEDSSVTSDQNSAPPLKSVVKEESELRTVKGRCSCKIQVKDKALQVSSVVTEQNSISKSDSLLPCSLEQSLLDSPQKSIGTSPLPFPRSSSNEVDTSGLDLFSQIVLEHADRLPSPLSLAQPPDSDSEASSNHSDTMPLLEPAIYSPSPRSSPSVSDNLPPILSPPVPLSLLHRSSSPKIDDASPPTLSETSPRLPSSCKGLHGLNLLCALAEQRILEEEHCCSALSSLAEVASTQTDDVSHQPGTTLSKEKQTGQLTKYNTNEALLAGPSHSRNYSMVELSSPDSDPEMDINRNYKSPPSQPENLALINKTSQCLQTDDMDNDVKDSHQSSVNSLMKRIFIEPLDTDTCSSPSPCTSPSKDHSQILESSNVLKSSGQCVFQGEDSWSKDLNFPTPIEPPAFPKIDERCLLSETNRVNANDKSPEFEDEPKESLSYTLEKPKIKQEGLFLKAETLMEDKTSMPDPSFKLPGPSLEIKLEESEEDPLKELNSNDTSDRDSKGSFAENSIESSTSDVELPSTLISSSKKRKPGRPKKHSPSKEAEATETIVAKKPKSMNYLRLSHSLNKTKVKPKLKAELKIRIENDDEKPLSQGLKDHGPKLKKQKLHSISHGQISRKRLILKRRAGATVPRGRNSLNRGVILRDKEKQLRMEALYRSLKKHSTMAAAEHDESEDEEQKPTVESIQMKQEDPSNACSPLHEIEEPQDLKPSLSSLLLNQPSEDSEKEQANEPSLGAPMRTINLSGAQISEEMLFVGTENKTSQDSTSGTVPKEESSVCMLQIEDLTSNARVLILQDGLLYAGSLSPITPPDVYGVHLDGERSTRPHIFCQEDLLTQAWKEVKPGSTRFLTEGTRVCAFWSQQYRGLYSGSVAPASSPSQEGNHNFVNVEFDDGDSGRIHIDDIRLLPQDFPIIEYDPNPLLTLNKRKRRPTEETLENESKPLDSEPSSKKCKKFKLKSPKEEITESLLDEEEEEPNKNGGSVSTEEEEIEDGEDETQQVEVNQNKKKHKKRRHSDHHKHKHKHRHKRKHKHQRPLPHVEPVDGDELRFRIKSPPPLPEEKKSPSLSVATSPTLCTETKPKEEVRSSEEEREEDTESVGSPIKAKSPVPAKRKKRKPSEKSKIAPFLLERRLWRWAGKGYRRPGSKGKGKKEFFKEIVRGKESIRVGDCAVFLSTGQPDRPYIGRIESLWESWGGNMMVKVKWFYHPEETKGLGKRLAQPKGALFHSSHMDENDVQTISHKCNVIQLSEYKIKRAELEEKNGPHYENYDLYYLAGFYDPSYSRITMEPGVS